jgi:hypothetical protein
VAVLAGLLGPVSIVVVGVLAEDCSKVPFVMRRAAGNLPCSVEDLPDLGPARQAAAILDEDGIGRRPNQANININTWEACSANGGVTWPSLRMSTRSWNPNLGFFSSGAFIGDYNGIAVSSTNVYPVWTEGRNTAIARTGIGEADIFTDVEHR